ncbi:MAG: group II intron maturase-specific domain-containing protein [Candidatus Entotheonellia bacterium]
MERKPESKTASLRTATAYKANGPGKVAQHTEALGAGPGVQAEVVQLQFAFLSGETSIPCTPGTGCGATDNRRVEGGGVSRGHSTAEAKAGRPEPVGCSSTPDPRPATQTPYGRVEGPEASEGKHGGAQANLLEQILSRENMLVAWKRVKAHQGAAGMAGMAIDAFPEFARQHWERLRSALEEGTYRPAAGLRVLRSISRFIAGRLRLRINWTKSQATRLSAGSFLGFELKRGKLRWTDAAVNRCKERIREITARSNGRSMESRIEALQRYVTGWLNYFGHSHSYVALVEVDHWLRRRVRLCYWKQWKRPRTRRRHLRALGRSRDEVPLATRSRKGCWRMAGNSIVQRALTNQWLGAQGVPNMRQQWVVLHYGASAP